MLLADSFWDGPQPYVYAALLLCVYPFLHTLVEGHLKSSFLRQGTAARVQQSIYNTLLRWELVSPIQIPNIDLENLIREPLPTGFTLRRWKLEDATACLDIYRLNAPGRFPDEIEQDFESRLKTDDQSMLVVEFDGVVIACGAQSQTESQAWLSYGLIHPEFQNQGIGRLLLLSRLARFDVPPTICVMIGAVEASIGYYERFGFKRFALWHSENGEGHPLAGAFLASEHPSKILEFLRLHGYSPIPILS
jgi:GNAT superfamily N-acetyltransferase